MTAVMDIVGAPLHLTKTGEARAARRTVRRQAATVISDPGALEDIELMTSEAIANAMVHGTPPVTVTVTCDSGTVRVDVRDEGTHIALARSRDHGRGLAIIDALATTWDLVSDETGTTLTFMAKTGGRAS